MSNTYNQSLNAIAVPVSEILIHTGNFTSRGTAEELEAFNQWLGTIPCFHRVVILGEREQLGMSGEHAASYLTNATYVAVHPNVHEIAGLNILCMPYIVEPHYTVEYMNQVKRGLRELQNGNEVHMICCHVTPSGFMGANKSKVGSEIVVQALNILQPQVMLFGECGEQNGYQTYHHREVSPQRKESPIARVPMSASAAAAAAAEKRFAAIRQSNNSTETHVPVEPTSVSCITKKTLLVNSAACERSCLPEEFIHIIGLKCTMMEEVTMTACKEINKFSLQGILNYGI